MSKPKIVAFVGCKQAGKSSASGVLKKIYPQVTELALAGLLKDSCCSVFGFSRSAAEDGFLKEKEMDPPIELNRDNLLAIMDKYKDEFEALGRTVNFDEHLRSHCGVVLYSLRQILQYIGTEVLKGIDPDIHCKVIARKMISNGVYIIPDMRFPSEFDFFHTDQYALHAFYIKNSKAESLSANDRHSSEKSILTTAQKCVTIENGGTLEEFQRLVAETLKGVLK